MKIKIGTTVSLFLAFAHGLYAMEVAMEVEPLVNVIDFQSIEKTFLEYEDSKNLHLRHRVIFDLGQLMNANSLGEEDKLRALEMAKSLEATILKVRLEIYREKKDYGGFSEDMMGLILSDLGQRDTEYEWNEVRTETETIHGRIPSPINIIKSLLSVSKSLNLLLSSIPVKVDGLCCSKNLNNTLLASMVQTLPNIFLLDLYARKEITDESLIYLMDLKRLSSLDVRKSGFSRTGLDYLEKNLKIKDLKLRNLVCIEPMKYKNRVNSFGDILENN